MDAQAQTILYLYLGVLVTFVICIMVVTDARTRRYTWPWVASNALAALSVYLLVDKVTIIGRGPEMGVAGFYIINAALKYHALRLGWRSRLAVRIDWFLYALLGLTALLIIIPQAHPAVPAALIFFAIGIFIAISAATWRNRVWRGVQGQGLMTVAYVAAIFAMGRRLPFVFPIGPQNTLLGSGDVAAMNTLVFLLHSFWVQLSFILMVVGRQNRLDRFRERRLIRSTETASRLKRDNAEIQSLLRQKQDLLDILTHEVRQPLNNAQAALETVTTELSRPSLPAAAIRDRANLVQSVIDQIVLSLSNAIVGARMADREPRSDLRDCDVVQIANLALLDCPAGARGRVQLTTERPTMYATCDPVILRLSLRNLLDNAVKYSPPDTPLAFDISYDHTRFGLTFAVTNQITDPALLEGPILERGARGQVGAVPGRGLGLFIVSQAARVHGGQIRFVPQSEKRVSFELFIPE